MKEADFERIAEAARKQVQPIILAYMDGERAASGAEVLGRFYAALSGLVTAVGHGLAVMDDIADNAASLREQLHAQLDDAFAQSKAQRRGGKA